MKSFILLLFCLVTLQTFSQVTDSLNLINNVVVHKDFRLDILARKELELNTNVAKLAARSAMGYRLQVLSTNDRELAMKTRTQLLQQFPDQKPYMSFQAPYVKLTFGNFVTKQEAESYRKQISKMMGGASIYLLPQRIEVKPEKAVTDDTNK